MTDLRERVARALCLARREDPDEMIPSLLQDKMVPNWDYYYGDLADAAIALVLEEAAKVADALEDALCVEWRKGLKCDSYLEGRSDGAGEAAVAIRALNPAKALQTKTKGEPSD